MASDSVKKKKVGRKILKKIYNILKFYASEKLLVF